MSVSPISKDIHLVCFLILSLFYFNRYSNIHSHPMFFWNVHYLTPDKRCSLILIFNPAESTCEVELLARICEIFICLYTLWDILDRIVLKF